MLKLCSVAQPTRLLPPSLPAVPRNEPSQQQRLRRIESEPELPQRSLTKTSCHGVEGTLAMPSATIRRDFDSLQAASMYHSPLMQSNAVAPTNQSHTWVNVSVSLHWRIMACGFLFRAGPVMKLLSSNSPKAQSDHHQPKKPQQIGLGLIFSIYLPQHLRRPFGLALLNFQTMITSRTTQTLHWNLSLPRTLPADAEIFNYTRAGSIHHVQRLLSLHRASPTDITFYGTTLLHSAARSGHLHLTRLLIREGADVNAQDEDGESPLHAAMAKDGNYNIARTLIEHGADLSSKAIDGKTPFHNLFNDTIGTVLMSDAWLEHTTPDAEGMSISHFLAWSSRTTLLTFLRARSCDEADLLAVDASGRNCLHFAAARGNLRVLEYLVSRVGPDDVVRGDAHGRTPVDHAGGSSRAVAVVDVLTGKMRCESCSSGSAVERADDGRRRGVPALELCGRREWREGCRIRASTLCGYLRGFISYSGLRTGLVDAGRLRSWYTSQQIGLAIAMLVMLIIVTLLGVPDRNQIALSQKT